MALHNYRDVDWSAKILAECIGEEPPPCQAACPLNIPVREKMQALQAGNLSEALALVLSRCPFPGILGRICSRPCESACTRNRVDQPLAIAPLKRYLADLDPEAAYRFFSPGPPRPEWVAVVGGGPAGLMAAVELRLLGYAVTLFEAEDALGGSPRLFIPPYRLPREVLDREVGLVSHLGAEVRLNHRLGQDLQLAELRRYFAAVFLALGTQRSSALDVPGADLPGVVDALAFLQQAHAGQIQALPDTVAVIGGGNVAVDAARTARRLGAREVVLICLETLEEMPAFPGEVHEARTEGVQLLHRWGVARIMGQGGRVNALELLRVMRVFDEEGRFAPEYDTSRRTTWPAPWVITAVGQSAALADLGLEEAQAPGGGRLKVDPVTLATGLPGLFAAGDVVTGPRSAVEAMAAGRRAALDIHHFLEKTPIPDALPPLAGRATKLIVDLTGVSPASREALPSLPVAGRLAAPAAEVEMGYGSDAARREAGRCLICTCSECVKNCTYLQVYAQDSIPTEKSLVRLLAEKGETEPRIPYSCHFCGLCASVCPVDLHAGQACLSFKERLVAQGRGPLPQHRGIQNFVKWGTSPTFTLGLADPATGRAERVFFPGCSLPGYSPHLVRAAYDFLRRRLPGTGLMLNCCGAPSLLLGERRVFEKVLVKVKAEFARLGGQELICACTHCLEVCRDFWPEIPSRSLYEVLLETGLPANVPRRPGHTFQVHDACGARKMPAVQDAVRRLAAEMGYNITEMAHSRERSICCGAGGMVPAVDPGLAQRMTDFRLAEAHHDLITYCATCRATLARAGHPALHLLDLIFNPAWPESRTITPAGSLSRWWRRWRLKRQLQKLKPPR